MNTTNLQDDFANMTVGLDQAAKFLGFKSKWRLIEKMKSGKLPLHGFKCGVKWMFFKDDVVNCARQMQNSQRKIAQVDIGGNVCHLAKRKIAHFGIQDSASVESECKNQLAALFDPKLKNTRTGVRKKSESRFS